MPDNIIPPWGPDWTPPPPPPPKVPGTPGNPKWVKGVSGNPKGRPPGRPDKRLLATQQMLDEMRNIVAVLVAQALEGDTGAASLVLSRVLPSLKAQAEKVNFPLDTTAPISEQVAQVLDAVAGGLLAPDVGRLMIESLKALADVRAVEDLEARIITLEAKEVRTL
jgi:hypothetical protein